MSGGGGGATHGAHRGLEGSLAPLVDPTTHPLALPPDEESAAGPDRPRTEVWVVRGSGSGEGTLRPFAFRDADAMGDRRVGWDGRVASLHSDRSRIEIIFIPVLLEMTYL